MLDLEAAASHDYVRTLCGEDAWPRGELDLPRASFGAGTPVRDVRLLRPHPAVRAFLQLQGVYERPFDMDRARDEAALRLVLGRSFTEGAWGRTWSPMVEVLANRELEGGATTHWDLSPQFQVRVNTRQHVMANLGVRLPVNDRDGREPRLLFYVLWDWFDGGFFEGW